MTLHGKPAGERGGVLITVLIVATVFAVLAYITLHVSLVSLEATDTHTYMYKSQLVAESGVESAAARLRQELGGSLSDPGYIDPSYALSTSEDMLRQDLIDSETTTSRQVDSFPITYERTAWTTTTSESTWSPDTDLISGSHDDATYSYLDDSTFSEDYPAYEFGSHQDTGALVVFGVGEIIEPEGEQTIFSFKRAEYPNSQWSYDVRETGVTEPSRLGPYPLIETEHPYPSEQSRGWVVTYQKDPRHPGRNITDLKLMADISVVQIDVADSLIISPWLESNNPPRFGGLLDSQVITGQFRNDLDEVFSNKFDATTLALYFKSVDPPPTPGWNNGFRVDGIRYGFDSESTLPYYETPHPYDNIVPPTGGGSLNIQTIYAPYQTSPLATSAIVPQMRIQFSPEFSLDSNDSLFLYNASDHAQAMPIAIYDALASPPADGWTPIAGKVDVDLPLGITIMLARSFLTDVTPDYGYKVIAMEYTDRYGNWVHVDDPIMESPHSFNLGQNDRDFTIPNFGLPFPQPIDNNYAGYQTIYRPFCPNTNINSGIGTVSNWWVTFSDGTDLTASSGPANNDRIRITSRGFNDLLGTGLNTVYFVHPDGSYGPWIGNIMWPNYFDIVVLNDLELYCSTALLLEIEFESDIIDEYEPSAENFGYRIVEVGYDTLDGADDDNTPPTIRTDVYFPSNTSYPAYGSTVMTRPEWWYTNKTSTPKPLVIGLHFDRYHFDLDPGDRLEIYDEKGLLIATLISDSVTGGPAAGGPENPDGPGGGTQYGGAPGAQGPLIPEDIAETLVDLNATFGWVLVPGTTAQVILVGDSDDNDGYAGFEIDHCGFVNGEVTEIRSYLTEYTELAYDQYYDRTSDAIQAFRNLGMN